MHQVAEQREILEKKLEEHKSLHKENENLLQEEINAMVEDLKKVKTVLDEKIRGLDDNDAPSNRASRDSLSLLVKSSKDHPSASRVSSLYVEVGDLDENDPEM